MSTPSSPQPQPYTIFHLDSLLTRYLHLLDTYTTQRTLISTTLSSSFLSLAQANRSSMLPPGQRYGQEMYDQRMKAGRRVRFVEAQDEEGERDRKEDGKRLEVEVYTYPEVAKAGRTDASRTQTETSNPSPPSKDTLLSSQPDPPTPSDPTPPPTSYGPSPSKPRNPISQFAALPPPPLRASQYSFTTAVVSHIPLLLNTSRSMALLEAEIGRVRRALGLDVDVDVDAEAEGEVEEEEEEDEGEKNDGKGDTKLTTSTSPTSAQLPNLARRRKVSEPRSRVLKLGS